MSFEEFTEKYNTTVSVVQAMERNAANKDYILWLFNAADVDVDCLIMFATAYSLMQPKQRHNVAAVTWTCFRDALAQVIDPHHDLRLILHLFAPVRHEEWPVLTRQRRLRFQEECRCILQLLHTRTHPLHLCQCVLQFLIMFGIVHAHANDLHLSSFLFFSCKDDVLF